MCVECDREPQLRHEHSVTAGHEADLSHACGGGKKRGMIPVVRYARSSCCGAVLKKGGTPETGFECTQCGKACERTVSARQASWKCPCGTVRHQQLADLPAGARNG